MLLLVVLDQLQLLTVSIIFGHIQPKLMALRAIPSILDTLWKSVYRRLKPIKVIDLFAGPGGLGEGFSAYRSKGDSFFKIAISIEKETSAHRTLTLRAVFRQFEHGKAPESYYAFLKGELGTQRMSSTNYLRSKRRSMQPSARYSS